MTKRNSPVQIDEADFRTMWARTSIPALRIAITFDCDVKTVYRYAHKIGLPPRHPKDQPKVCRVCGITGAPDIFAPVGGGNTRSMCKPCNSKRVSEMTKARAERDAKAGIIKRPGSSRRAASTWSADDHWADANAPWVLQALRAFGGRGVMDWPKARLWKDVA